MRFRNRQADRKRSLRQLHQPPSGTVGSDSERTGNHGGRFLVTEAIKYHLGGTFRGSYVPLNDNIINGRIRGIGGVVGCNNCRTVHDSAHLTVVKELLKNDVIVLTTGCNAMACGKAGLLTPEAARVYCGPGLAEVCETVGIPAGPAYGLLRGQQPHPHGGFGSGSGRRPWQEPSPTCPAAGSAPEWMSEKAISIGHYFVALPASTPYLVSICPVTGRAQVPETPVRGTGRHLYGGMWDLVEDPYEHAAKMIAHIDKKRKALGIDKARDRVLMDMADRQKLDAA